MKTIDKLKEIRKARKLTQKQVAEMLGMQCEDRISHWERGQAMPSVRNLLKLSKIYKTKSDDMIIVE